MRDIRFNQRWTTWQRVKNGVLYAAGYALIKIVSKLPYGLALAGGRTLGWVCWLAAPCARRRASRRLALAFGDRAHVTARQVFVALGQDLLRAAWLFATEREAKWLTIEPRTKKLLDGYRRDGVGVVFVTAHSGLMDWMSMSVAAQGYDVAVVARESYDPRFTKLLESMRRARGVATLYRGRSLLGLVRRLRRGSIVGFAVDFPGRGTQRRDVFFLGAKQPLAVGPVRLAGNARFAIVVGAVVPGSRGLQVEVEPFASDDDQDEQQRMQRLADMLARQVLRLPQHWPWMFW